jgi:uncharacterized protein (TIGR03437 family)
MVDQHTFRNWKFLLTIGSGLALWSMRLNAQAAPPAILHVDIENIVQYCGNVSDYSQLAATPSQTNCTLRTFGEVIILADVVAVNGKPAKGTLQQKAHSTNLRPAPTAGQAIADTNRNGPAFDTLEILQPDGTPVGSIMVIAAVSGSPPPGAPSDSISGNAAVVGGTGAYLGVRGIRALSAAIVPNRNASMAEDPANRRIYGGGKQTLEYVLFPMSRPTIITTNSAPSVVHSTDFTPVTAANPAKAGEVLSLFATDLGPVNPGIDPGKPFPTSPLTNVNSPVDVTVNGTSAQVVGAVGYPGATNGYQVNFRIPADAVHGTASLQLSVAWIPSAPISIAIQ